MKPGATTTKSLRMSLHIKSLFISFSTTDGNIRVLKLPAHYVPKAKVCLLSECTLLQTYQGETILAQANKRGLSGIGGDPSRGRIEAQVDGCTNLPVSTGYLKEGLEQGINALNSTLSNVSKANMNLKESEKEFLHWHYWLGHLSFCKVQFLLRTGVLTHLEHTWSTLAIFMPQPPIFC